VLSILLPVLAVLMILSTLIDWGRPSWRPRHSGKEKRPGANRSGGRRRRTGGTRSISWRRRTSLWR